MSEQKCPFSQGFDPTQPEQQHDPFSWIADARSEAPVFYNEKFNVWVVTAHKDIEHVFKHPDIFTAQYVLVPVVERDPQALSMLGQIPPAIMALEASPEDHQRLRKPFTQYFNIRTLSQWQDRIETIVDELIDGFIQNGKVDFVENFAKQLPAKVIVEMVGVPDEDLAKVETWATAFISVVNSVDATPEQQTSAAQALLEFGGYIGQKLQTIDLENDDSFMAQVFRYHLEDPERMSMPELIKTLMSTIPAGYQTTKNTLVMGMKTLLDNPEFSKKLKDNPDLYDKAMDEIIRYQAGLLHWRRTTTQDVEISGVKIPAGQTLLLHLASAGRDEEIFASPDTLDAERKNAHQHLVFGTGIHRCVGSQLAKLEMSIAYRKLFARLPNLRISADQTDTYEKTLLDRILQSLIIEWDTP